MLKKIAEKYNDAINDPDTITKVQNSVFGLTSKTCMFIFVILFLLGGGYFVFRKLNSDVLSFLEQQQIFQIFIQDMHSVTFEKLGSSRFEKKIGDKSYVCTVIMDDIFSMPIDMMGNTIPGVPDPFISNNTAYLFRNFSMELMYIPPNVFYLPDNSEPQIYKENFLAIKRANGDYAIVLAAPVMEEYNKNVKNYRQNVRRQAEEYLRQQQQQKSQPPPQPQQNPLGK